MLLSPPDRAGVDQFHNLLISRCGARLKIYEESEFAVGRLAPALGDASAARHVHGNGLGQKNVLARLDSGGGLLRVKVGRAFNRHGVERLFQQLAVAAQPGETLFRRHSELVARVVNLVLKIIGHGHDAVAAMLFEQIGNPRAAPAAPERPLAELLAPGRS